MKIFHVSDLHLGIKLENYDLSVDQRFILEQMVTLAVQEQPDCFLIAGDIYDKSVPSAEAVQLFDDFLTKLHEAVPGLVIMAIAGNHDSAQRVHYASRILEKQKVHMAGIPPRTPEEWIEKVVVQDTCGPVNFYLLPFVKPLFVRKVFEKELTSYDDAVRSLILRENISTTERNVILSHQYFQWNSQLLERMSSEVTTVGNIDACGADMLEPFDYAALGHIHKPMKVGKETIRYSGTPLQYSIDEAGQTKGILMVELKEKHAPVTVEVLALTPLRRIQKLEDLTERILSEAYGPSDDFIHICLTDQTRVEVLDLYERLRDKFPHLLGVKRKYMDNVFGGDPEHIDFEKIDPYEMFLQFEPGLTTEEKKLLQDVINQVKEEL